MKPSPLMILMIVVLLLIVMGCWMLPELNTPTNGLSIMVENNGTPIANARVYAFTGPPTPNYSGALNGTTDSSGHISFNNIPNSTGMVGGYSIVVPGFTLADGSSYAGRSLSAQVNQYGVTVVDVSLVRASNNKIDSLAAGVKAANY